MKHNRALEQETIEMSYTSLVLQKMGKIEEITLEELQEEIEKNGKEAGVVQDDDEIVRITFKKSGNVYKFDFSSGKTEFLDNTEVNNSINLVQGDVEILLSTSEWTNKNLQATIKVKDGIDLSGNIIQYKIDDKNWKQYNGEIEVSENCLIVARVKNNITGLSQYTVSKEVTIIDKKLPVANLQIIEQNTSSAKVKVSANDDDSGIKGYYYSKDGVNYSNITTDTTYTFDKLFQGTEYEFWVKVEDIAGNEIVVSTSGETGNVEKVGLATANPAVDTKTDVKITLPTKTGYTTVYTINKTIPTKDSIKYTGSFEIDHNCTISYCYSDGTNVGDFGTIIIDNIDKMPPKSFIPTTDINRNSIQIIASTEDQITDGYNGEIDVTYKYYYKKSTDTTYTLSNKSNLENLEENTLYDMYVEAIDKVGNSYTTDIFQGETFRTITLLSSYNCIGSVQKYTIPETGLYQLECWGASGGDINSYTGGNGAYTKGDIQLEKGTVLYLFVGGQGTRTDVGGYNGGASLIAGQSYYGASGGGATDIRIMEGFMDGSHENWDDSQGLKNRIMVAAGGGGANDRNGADQNAKYGSGNGGAGGELIGESGKAVDYKATDTIVTYNHHCIGEGGSQTIGGKMLGFDSNDNLVDETLSGSFGMCSHLDQSGGGSGYYGGGTSGHGGAGGGSSFISGYTGCNAIDSNGNHTNQPNHFSGKIFENAIMIAGNKSMPASQNNGTVIGNDGDGYIKISIIK